MTAHHLRMPPVTKPKHDRTPNFLRQWRKFRELSQEAAAERVEVDRTTLGRIETGHLPYNQDFLERLAHAYGCDVVDLLSTDPLRPDPPRLVYDRLRKVSPDVQRQALAILDAFLRTAA